MFFSAIIFVICEFLLKMPVDNKTPITKAIIPAAGFGTRFLPQTKAMPKEMLPLVDKPIIQHIVEQLVKAGVKDVIIVTGYHKRSIEDHFDTPNAALLNVLKEGGKKKRKYLEEVERISKLANFYFLRQKGPRGNMTPLMNALPLIGEEPVFYLWADDFFDTDGYKNEFEQLAEAYNTYKSSLVTCIDLSNTDDESVYSKYAFVKGKKLSKTNVLIESFIEKPGSKSKAPSSLASVSSQVYTPDALKLIPYALKRVPKGVEFSYDFLIDSYIKQGGRVIAHQVNANHYVDTGNKLAYLKAQVIYGLKDKDTRDEFKQYLKSIASTL